MLPGGLSSSASGINSVGQVVGTSGSSTGDSAFVWDNGVLRNLGVMANFVGGGSSTASAINAAGLVVGTNTNVFGTHGFVWQNGSFTDLGDLAGGADYSAAYAINALGQVAGVSTASPGSRAVLGRNGVAGNLGDLQGGLDYSAATGVNAAGLVKGHSYYGSTYRYAFLWQNGVISSLGALPGGVVSVAAGLNDAGQVVGGSSTGDGDRAFVWQNGVMRNLGVLGAPPGTVAKSDALAINNAGQVVGISAYDQSATRAFLWSQGAGMVDLQALLPAGTAARVSRAAAVNDSGQIVGTAIVNGAAHAMLQTPGGTLAWQAAGNGSFADGANSELGFVPSRWVDVVIAPAASTTVLGPAAAMGANTLTVGGAGAGLVTLQLQRDVITLGDGGAQATLAANVTLTGDGGFEGSVSNRSTVAVSNLSVSFGLYNEAAAASRAGASAPCRGSSTRA